MMCETCLHAVPVTAEFPTYDGRPIFCACQFEPHYKMLRWPQPCINYEPKDGTRSADNPTSNGGRSDV